MDSTFQARLALMGHPLRVGVFRLLVRRLPHSIAAGEIAEALGAPPSTLSAHLAGLARARLITQEKDGPMRLYRAAPDRLAEALEWLGRDVCAGRADVAPLPFAGPVTLLFLCDDNAGLSLMAEALARGRLRGRVRVLSAGLHPARAMDPLALTILRLRDHDPVSLMPKGLRDGVLPDIVISLTPGAAAAAPLAGGELPPLHGFWPLLPPAPEARLIPRAMALHRAYRALDARLGALGRVPMLRLPRHAVQAALDDLSSGLPATGRVFASPPAHRRRSACPAQQASEAS
ncbi:hypothetical protein GCM10011415_42070 [Salipiger pallidus]|uniref:HTH arsR-type domain-containing protein n=1 Tax=Salipiger pallidus TaxID=1775170 RepID=A0A8J2ZNQ3_9RHOB|nr:helix-turn-helix domain-containing protein [Salipiger pallidus]GGG87144.1 hypothetical protein GCM10011415_42070 [Salipiger pallidus]